MLDLSQTEQEASARPVALRTERDIVVVVGPDASSYLHGQLSQDVTGMAAGDSRAALLLQPQGRVDAWGRLTRIDDETYWYDVEAGHGPAVVARLERFRLRVAVEITASTRPLVALRGPAAADLVGDGATGADGVVVLRPVWPGAGGVDLVADDPSWLPDGVAEGDPAYLEIERVALGRPAMGAEIDSSTIPAAVGVVEASVSFTKGCYVGQELVARIDSRGAETPTHLCGVRAGGGGGLGVGDGIVVAGAPVGTVTSAVDSVTRGVIGLASVKRGTALGPAGVGAGGAPVELVALPFAPA